MLYRKVSKQIKDWIEHGDDALLVTGARQVGKTYLIEKMLEESGKNFVKFNFIKQPKDLEIFKSAIENDADTFLENLSIAGKKTLKKDDIVFFDEIQECKEIITIIKFLVEHGKYRYILSGSLLGIELKNVRSAPVGYMTTVDMYPMDLEEFYIANGLSNDTIQSLRENFSNKTPVNDYTHKKLIDAFYKYLIIGGMPKAVQKFIDEEDYNAVIKVHKQINREYKRDFTRYEEEKKLVLINSYNLIPSELNTKNKRYVLTNLKDELRFNRFENSFLWLSEAGVALPCYNVTEPSIPLLASKKSNLFKLYLSDVGMLTTMYGRSTILKLLNKEKDINYGSSFENFAGQELKAHGFDLFYFNNKKHGELDFLIEYDGDVLPIEIKSGKDYQIHSALSYFCTTMFKRGFVFSNYNVMQKGNITYYPIYMLMFIQNDETINIKGILDLKDI